MSKRESKKARTRIRILEAAERVFGDRGFDQGSLADISRMAGVGLGTVYGYFPSKRSLFIEILRKSASELRQLLSAHGWQEVTTDGVSVAWLAPFLDWVAEHQGIFKCARREATVDEEIAAEWYGPLVHEYAIALDKSMGGSLGAGDAELLASATIGLVDFVAFRYVSSPQHKVSPELVDELAAITRRIVPVASVPTWPPAK